MAASVTMRTGPTRSGSSCPTSWSRLLGLALQVRVDLERGTSTTAHGVWRWAGCVDGRPPRRAGGGFLGVEGRTWLWALAVCGDLAATSFAGRGYLWDLHAAHFAERHGLFVIIALGESLIVAGTAVARTSAAPSSSLRREPPSSSRASCGGRTSGG
jgi:hypothetical protein